MNKDELVVNSHKVFNRIKCLIKTGNGNRIVIKDKKGKILFNLPVTLCACFSLLAPILSGAGFGLAYLSECKISIEKK